jgi:hypothetical protein
VSLIVYLIEDINITIINKYFNLNNNNLILLLIKLFKLLLVLFITISNYNVLNVKIME